MSKELIPLKPEEHPVTLLPKFTTDLPFFYLTKQKEALKQNISFEDSDAAGRPIRWKVRPNRDAEIGVPGIDAHEVWLKLIKPALDDERERAGGNLPDVIPLGSVRECLRTLGWTAGGFQSRDFLRTLNQIGSAWCEADFWLPTTKTDEEGKPLFRHIKGSFSRMTLYAIGSAHVTEEELKSGTVSFDFDLEDTVYIQLHPIETEIQRNQPQRPIDNEYLFSVSPAARRWYELLAPKFYGVTQNLEGRGYCEILYSWYVERHHTLKRHTQRFRVVEQMNNLIQDHLTFGYVSKVEYVEVKKSEQESDFIIRYYPGSETRESTKRIRSRIGKKRLGQFEISQPNESTRPPAQKKAPIPTIPALSLTDEQNELMKKLADHGVHIDTATKLVSTEPEEVKRQLEYLPYRTVKKNKGGLLRDAILGRWTPPDEYLEFKKRELEQQENQERIKRKKAEEAEAATHQKKEEELKRAYFDYLKGREAQLQKDQPKAYSAFLKDTAAKRAAVENDSAHKGAAKKIYLRLFDDEESHLERLKDFFKESTFEEWREQNLNRVQPSPVPYESCCQATSWR